MKSPNRSAVVALASALALVGTALAARVDVYANAFREGGWKLDVQFMDVMGSPYLIAHGLGSPVPDATAVATVPEAGTWRVYVRSRKWVDGAGRFQVLVDGRALGRTFGAGSDKWAWEDGGEVALPQGKVKLALRDLDGFDGRCAGGEAAAMCAKGGYSPRELYTKGHVRELQVRLAGAFPGHPDPAQKDWRIVDDEDESVRFEGNWYYVWNQLPDSGFWQDLAELDLEPGATLEMCAGKMDKSAYANRWYAAFVADGFALVRVHGD